MSKNRTRKLSLCQFEQRDVPAVVTASISPDVSSYLEGNSGTGALVPVTIKLSNPLFAKVRLTYFTQDGSANSNDYSENKYGVVDFLSGETTKIINIRLKPDTILEPNEDFFVGIGVSPIPLSQGFLSPTSIDFGQKSARVWIVNDEIIPLAASVTGGSLAVTEGNPGSPSVFDLTVSLNRPHTHTVSVGYQTLFNTGTGYANSQDIQSATGTLYFAPGEVSKKIAIQINPDYTIEGNEMFRLRLHTPTGTNVQAVATPATTLTILNDDATALAVNISPVQAAVSEGSGTLPGRQYATVSLTRPHTTVVSVNYRTVSGGNFGTAASNDLNHISGRLTFQPGETSKHILIGLLGDEVTEQDETYTIELLTPSGMSLGSSPSVKMTILNDDGPDIDDTDDTGGTGGGCGGVGESPYTYLALTRSNGAGITWQTFRDGQPIKTLTDFGLAGDITVAGDWNGDGKSDQGVARPNRVTGLMDWYLDLNNDGYLAEHITTFGWATDTPMVGDFNGDGKSDLVALRKNTSNGLLDWYIDTDRVGTAHNMFRTYGWATDTPVVGDWNGDRKADMGVVRNQGGKLFWYLDHNNGIDTAAEEVFEYGVAGHIPIVGDFNNDGRVDFGVGINASWGMHWSIDTNKDRLGDVGFNFGQAGDRMLVMKL